MAKYQIVLKYIDPDSRSEVCKGNKIWVDKASEYCYSSFESWLQRNSIEMYWTHISGKSVVSQTFIGTLKGKIL